MKIFWQLKRWRLFVLNWLFYFDMIKYVLGYNMFWKAKSKIIMWIPWLQWSSGVCTILWRTVSGVHALYSCMRCTYIHQCINIWVPVMWWPVERERERWLPAWLCFLGLVTKDGVQCGNGGLWRGHGVHLWRLKIHQTTIVAMTKHHQSTTKSIRAQRTLQLKINTHRRSESI